MLSGAGVAGGGEGELVGAGAEIDGHGGGQRGAEGDGVGAGAAGDGLGTLATVAELAKSPKVRVSAPPPRSMEALTAAAARVTMSAPAPPMTVSTFLSVAVLPAAARVSLSAAGAEVDARHWRVRAEGDGVVGGAAGEGLDVGDGDGVGEVAEGEVVGAGGEIDRRRWRRRRRG